MYFLISIPASISESPQLLSGRRPLEDELIRLILYSDSCALRWSNNPRSLPVFLLSDDLRPPFGKI